MHRRLAATLALGVGLAVSSGPLSGCGQENASTPQVTHRPQAERRPAPIPEAVVIVRREALERSWEHGRALLESAGAYTLSAENRFKQHVTENMPPDLAEAPPVVHAAYRSLIWDLATIADRSWESIHERVQKGLVLKRDGLPRLLELWNAAEPFTEPK